MLRIINADKSGYIFPDIILHDYGVNLEVLQSVLQDLVEQGHIQILLSPNRKLTDEDRARKDDEQDYYFIDVDESFADYYRQLEQTAEFHNADREHDQPSLASSINQSSAMTAAYNYKDSELRIGKLSINMERDSDQDVFCKRLFPNGKPAKRPVQKMELFKRFGYDPDYIDSSQRETVRKKLYSTRTALNAKILNKSEGKIKQFFTPGSTFWINAKYR
jgi:hypothetical protein